LLLVFHCGLLFFFVLHFVWAISLVLYEFYLAMFCISAASAGVDLVI